MQDALFDFLGAALVPVLGADVAARAARDVHRVLIGVAALGALPHELAVLVLDDLDLAVPTALLAVVALRVQLRVHDVVVDELHHGEDRRNVVLHVRHLHVGDGASGRKGLELRLKRKLLERTDRLRHMHVVGVGDVVAVGDVLDDAETLLQAFRETVCRRLERSAVKGIVDVLGFLPLRGVLVELLHYVETERLALELGKFATVKCDYALPETGVAEGDRGVPVVEQPVDLLSLLETRQSAVLPEDRRSVGKRSEETVVAAA